MLRRNPALLFLAGLIACGAFALGRFSARPALTPPLPAVRAEGKTTATPAPAAAGSPNAGEARAADRLAAAIQSVHAAPDRATRLYAFALRLHELGPAHYPALLQALQRTRGPDTPELMAMVCSVWAAHDGPGAFTAARGLVASDGEYQALHSAIVAWAQREPSAALAALRAADMADPATDEMAALMQGWARRDVMAAEAFLKSAGSAAGANDGEVPAAMRRGFEAIAAVRIASNPALAMEWYGQLRAPLPEQLRQAVLIHLAAVDPQAASAWLARDAAAQVGATDLLPVLRGLQLAGFDQQFAWASTPANPETRESALTAVVQEAAPTQLLALGEWLAARADDASLAPAFSAYAAQVVRKSPNAAVAWAMSLDQPARRQQALNSVAAEWMTVSPRAAREWAQRTGLVDWDALVR